MSWNNLSLQQFQKKVKFLTFENCPCNQWKKNLRCEIYLLGCHKVLLHLFSTLSTDAILLPCLYLQNILLLLQRFYTIWRIYNAHTDTILWFWITKCLHFYRFIHEMVPSIYCINCINLWRDSMFWFHFLSVSFMFVIRKLRALCTSNLS